MSRMMCSSSTTRIWGCVIKGSPGRRFPQLRPDLPGGTTVHCLADGWLRPRRTAGQRLPDHVPGCSTHLPYPQHILPGGCHGCLVLYREMGRVLHDNALAPGTL